jgi:hypothetical protein
MVAILQWHQSFFTAHNGFKTKQEALESAEELFGAPADG